jgi:hypothetical protein
LPALGPADHDVELDLRAVRREITGETHADHHATGLDGGAGGDEQHCRRTGEQEAEEQEGQETGHAISVDVASGYRTQLLS